MVQLEDSRPQSERDDFPWWWRDETLPIHQQLAETYEKAFAIHYELGRRYLIRKEGIQASKLPSMPRMLSDFASLRMALFYFFTTKPHSNSSLKEFTYSAHCNVWKNPEMIACVDMMRGKDASSSEILEAICSHLDRIEDEANSDTFRQIPRSAWDLTAPWKWVTERLQSVFEIEQRKHGFESRSAPRKMREGWHSPLETWDLWAADIYAEKNFPSSSDNQRRSAARHNKSGQKHGPFAKWLIHFVKNTEPLVKKESQEMSR